ncbi:MAG: 3-isopropylmalate dehydratase small subunit [Pseudolabrys sp.]|jgi:3-isopropylmalate/(R)-2-methylmalate dehydratase small subunit
MAREMIKGAVTVLGGFVSADAVLPARFSFVKPEEMAEHVLEEISPEINAAVRARPIIVAGEAFGYGTGRESPARALRAAGVRAIIGGPFARMFFRNAINNGVLVLDCAAIVTSGIADGDEVEIDAASGLIRWKDREFETRAVPEIIQNIISAGSLIDYGRTVIHGADAKRPA